MYREPRNPAKRVLVKTMNDEQLDAILKDMAAKTASTEAQPPSAGQIWFRAQILRKKRRQERIERPLAAMRGIAVAICLAAVLLFAFQDLGALRATVSGSYLLPLAVMMVIVALASWIIATRATGPTARPRRK